jgi:phage shock protein PspC (stress-responsive transcriptional regulator)
MIAMQKVISINLNGHAYQLDESGYDALRAYLARAEHELEANPDRVEIMADLEQAIADKCQKFLGPHKSVVNASEVEQIVKEMGPIDAAAGEDSTGSTDPAADNKEGPRAEPAPKRLYRIPDGAMIAGVCNGLAAYFAIDVAFVRVAFALAAFFTKGVGFIAYVVMMFVIPEAHTPEERASAGGAPFNAKEVIDRAKKQYAEGSRQWRQRWRQQQRQWRRRGWAPGAPVAYSQPPWAAALLPVFALVHLALFLTMATMMISLVNTGAILSWRPPEDVPIWAGALILLVAYQIVVSPIRAAQHWYWHPRAEVQPGQYVFWNAVVWLIGMAFIVWFASDHIPEIREFVQRLPQLVREFAYAMRDIFQREGS